MGETIILKPNEEHSDELSEKIAKAWQKHIVPAYTKQLYEEARQEEQKQA